MKPTRLPIYTFAPSGKVTDQQSIHDGIEFLKDLGFQIHNTQCIDRSYERFAGLDSQRASEINSFYEITNSLGPCIALAVRGGYGLTRLLPHINWDNLAQAVDNGLQIVGHSDLTALEVGLFAQTGRKSYAGPMLSYDFGCNSIERSLFTTHHFLKILIENSLDFSNETPSNQFEAFKAEGVLWGGNLTILNSLIGTPYFPNNALIKNGILFIEDTNEHPYRIERMLFQLLQIGVLGKQQAILLGNFSGYQLSSLDNGYDLDSCIKRIQDELKLIGSPTRIFTELPFGHCRDKLTLPIGINCQVISESNKFSLKTL
ncbi:MAG: LD-carboxypeptidase [Betaproteobacteria bacterium]